MRRLMSVLTVIALLALPSAALAADGGRPFVVPMVGAEEFPGPGDPDGSGTAWLTLNHGQGEVCWTIFVQDITLPATGAHIHRAPAGSPGGIVVPLTAPGADGWSSGCTGADQDLIKEIQQSPWEFYVNVHTLPLYAAGAVRGQLSK